MKINEVMTKDVKVTNYKDSVQEAARLMKAYNLGSIPVEKDEKIIGMLTDRDMALTVIAEGRDPKSTRVEECMHEGIKYCYEDEEVDGVCSQMSELKMRRLPVMSREKRLVGIVSLDDLMAKDATQKVAASALGRICA